MHLAGLGRRGIHAGADRPDRFIGERATSHVLDREPGPAGSTLSLHDRERQPLTTLRAGLAHAQERLEPVAKSGGNLAVDLVVRLVEDVSALRVPEQDEPASQLDQHWRRHLTGERAAVLPVAVLRTEPD